MDLKYIGFIVMLGALVIIGAMSFVKNFHGLLKMENPTKKDISYNENLIALTLFLFMLWIVLVQISIN